MKTRHLTYNFNTIDNAYAQEGPEEENPVYELEGVSRAPRLIQEPVNVEKDRAPCGFGSKVSTGVEGP